MKENEAIEILKNNYPKTCRMVNGRYQGGFDNVESDFGQALTMAISALKEVKQYREIGTVEEIKSVKKYIDLKRRCGTPTNTIDVCAEYIAIGTVEECREAVEKQNQKPLDFYGDSEDGKLLCPNCGNDFWELKECGFNNCPYCGQAIYENWRE